jgi:hypothetical protein
MTDRVRVRFRYRTETGEVEMFVVESVAGDASDTDHDRRHDAAASGIARVIERNAQIDEVPPGDGDLVEGPATTVNAQPGTEVPERRREGPTRG